MLTLVDQPPTDIIGRTRQNCIPLLSPVAGHFSRIEPPLDASAGALQDRGVVAHTLCNGTMER